MDSAQIHSNFPKRKTMMGSFFKIPIRMGLIVALCFTLKRKKLQNKRHPAQ